jgi:hypothetical protein
MLAREVQCEEHPNALVHRRGPQRTAPVTVDASAEVVSKVTFSRFVPEVLFD